MVILVSACAPRVAEMEPDTPICTDCKYFQLYKDAIAIKSITTSDSLLDNEANSEDLRTKFTDALANSLTHAGLFTRNQGSERFFLDVRILNVRDRNVVFTTTVYVKIRYRLTRSIDRQLIHEDTFESKATRGRSDSFLVLDRSRLSLESAVRENIHEFLETLLGN
jgi:hypothetical protein